MPITQSAKKALRQSMRRRAGNLSRAKAMKAAIKALKASPSSELLSKACGAIDKAAKANIIHRNRAARLKAGFSRLVSGKKKNK